MASSVADRIVSRSSTTRSGGSPPLDCPRSIDQAATVDDVRLLPNRRTPLADPADGAAVDQDGTVLQLRAGVVHGDDHPATVEQDHEPARRRVAARWTASRIFW